MTTTTEGFSQLGLSAPVLRAIEEMGFEEPTPVQSATIPLLMQERDVVAQALTGTGKTAAYGIPMVERLDGRLNHPQAIVLAPTRELAVQVAEHLTQLSRYKPLRFLPIYGGQPIERQLRALSRGVHGIVATPGRLMDHMRRGTVDLSDVRYLVLDEADQMLQMGFQEDVEYIVGHLPSERLTALFSATMPQPILNIVHNYMRTPEMIHLSRARELTVPAVDQVFYVVPFPRKFDALCRVLDARGADRTVVFCATKRMVDEVVERLPARGYAAEGLHGDISQAGRERVLQSFRNGRTEVLVATDVAARGLDIADVGLVVNFDIPPDPEYYVHRIGRTARVGRGGEAVTFVNPREIRELQIIERVTGAKIRRAELPTAAEAEERENELLEERLLSVLDKGGWQRYLAVIEGLEGDHDATEIAAAAVAMAMERRAGRPTDVPETPLPDDTRPRPYRAPRAAGQSPRTGAPQSYRGKAKAGGARPFERSQGKRPFGSAKPQASGWKNKGGAKKRPRP